MNDTADVWILFAQNDTEFGNKIAARVKTEFQDKLVRTSSDFSPQSHPSKLIISKENVVIIILPDQVSTGTWFCSEMTDVKFSGTSKILTIQYQPKVETPDWLATYETFNFTNDAKFDTVYAKFLDRVRFLTQ